MAVVPAVGGDGARPRERVPAARFAIRPEAGRQHREEVQQESNPAVVDIRTSMTLVPGQLEVLLSERPRQPHQ